MKIPYPVKVMNGDIVKLAPAEKPFIYDKAPQEKYIWMETLVLKRTQILLKNVKIFP